MTSEQRERNEAAEQSGLIKVWCPDCRGSGESGLIPLCAKTIDGKPLTDDQVRNLKAILSICQFCGGAGLVPEERIEWKKIGEQWQRARRAKQRGIRDWADHVGCLPSDYCHMEQGRMKPDDKFSPL